MINNDVVQEPSDINFSEPYNLYKEAYDYDQTNPDANFGLALTGIFMITQDQDIDDAFDEWTTYLQSNIPFDAPLAKRRQPTFPTSLNDFKIPINNLAKAITGTCKMAFLDAPKLGSIQGLMESKLLPKINFACRALDRVDNNPGYVFTLTPKMQGDLMADPLQIDLTEIYALEVGVNLFAFLVNMGLSYNVDMNSYDSLGIIESLTPGSSFLTVRQSGLFLTNAKNALLTAANKIIAGISFLRDETDDQSDDIIKVDPQDEADLDEIINSTNDFLDRMVNGFAVTDDWDDDPATPEEELTFDFSEFFDDPIEDFKQLVPAYNVSVGRDTLGYEYEWNYESTLMTATVNLPQAGYYFYNRYYQWTAYGYVYAYTDSNISIPEFKQAIDEKIAQLSVIPNLYDFSVSIYWSGSFPAGYQQIQADLWYDYSIESPSRAMFVPIITWNANSFQEWIFPDPTFSGILPGMTDSEFKHIFGITADDWSKSTKN
jgi:hypothetical protein